MTDFFIEADAEQGRVWIEVPGTDLYLPAAEALALGHTIETAALRALGLIASDERREDQDCDPGLPHPTRSS